MKFKVETRIIIVLIEVPKRNSTAPRTWNILVYVYATPGTELSHDESYSYIHIWADDKKGYTPPQNVDKKGDTAFGRPRGFRRTCGRWHQSNGPAGCMRFHGTLFFIYSPLLYQNSQMPDGLWYKHSSAKSQTYVRATYLICAPRARVSSKKSLIIFRAY